MNLAAKLGKIPLAHVVNFYGKSGDTIMTRYKSNDPVVIDQQLRAIQSVGIQGMISLTYGAASLFVQSAVVEQSKQCTDKGMFFALCMDPWVTTNQPDKTAAVIAYLKQADTQAVLNAPSYLPEKYVLDFETKADPGKVMAATGVKILSKNSGFWWPNFPKDGSQNVTIPGLCPCFNDGTPGSMGLSWQGGPTRLKETDAGNYWWDQVAALPSSKYVQVITWNDYHERTVLEPFASMLWGRIGK